MAQIQSQTRPQTPSARSSRTSLGDVAVLGFGVSGEAVVDYLIKAKASGRVRRIAVFGRVSETREAKLRDAWGKDVEIWPQEELEGCFDLAIASPGISVFSDFFQSAVAHAREVVGEPEFSWRESPEKWIVITGTNGKTTTTTLTEALLLRAGLHARALGNVGRALCHAVENRDDEWFVAELSSFQLATTRELHPKVSVLLNVTPDHLAWHRSFEHYMASKERVFANMAADDLAVLVVDDPCCRAIAPRLRDRGLRVLAISASGLSRFDREGAQVDCDAATHAKGPLTSEDTWPISESGRPTGPDVGWIDNGRLVIELAGKRKELCLADELSIQGPHNATNALAAAAIACFLGVDAAVVAEGLTSFRPLAHRVEPIATIRGVSYVDDSKATNTDAVEKALRAFEPGRVIVLLGGTDKGTSLESLARAVSVSCKGAICYGEAGPRIQDALESVSARSVIPACHLADAFEEARRLAEPGDVVLLSPACSSFDEFSGFEERGRAFRSLVERLEVRP